MPRLILDLFAGVGGLSFGFDNNHDFKVVSANEILPDMAEAYKLNHPEATMFNCDIKELNKNRIFSESQIPTKQINIVVGGPPCQAYSTVGKRLLDDPRGKLFQEYYRLLQELTPEFFLFENVSGLTSMNGGNLIKYIIDLFQNLGYHTKYRILDAADYGVPQHRERVIIVGSVYDNEFEYPTPTHSNDSCFQKDIFMDSTTMIPHLTLEDALSDLPLIRSGEESRQYASPPQNDYQKEMRKNNGDVILDHNAPYHGDKLQKLMNMLEDGECAHDLPEEFRPTSGYKNTYCKLWWQKPSTTVTRNFGTPSSSRCIHPICNRGLTTREGARLQSFPDSFKFYGSRVSKNLQIGNAVPPLLSKALAESIHSYLRNK